MNTLYNLFLKAYYFIIYLGSFFNAKAKLWISGRKDIFNDLKALQQSEHPRVWFHCASLGEFEQARPIIERIKNDYPQWQVILTFFSPSGYEIRKKYQFADVVTYLPFDTRLKAHKFIELMNPSAVFFIKYEFWKNILHELKKRNVPVYLVSAIFRENQMFFKAYGRFFTRILHSFQHIFVQDEKSYGLLQEAGVKHTSITGDTRFDRVWQVSKDAVSIPVIEKFKDGKLLIMGGSTWEPDEDLLIRYLNTLQGREGMKMVFAPHETDIKHINTLLKKLEGKKTLLYTDAQQNQELNLHEYDVLIINTIGILSSAYKYADIAYVGGGFGVGIHNTLEPAVFRIPVLFGPAYKKFAEAVALKEMNGGFSIHDYNVLEQILNRFVQDSGYRKECGTNAGLLVEQSVGATQKVLEHALKDMGLS